MSEKQKRAEFVPYSEKLRNPKWQMKRLKIMERDGAACRECGATDKTLNVHHAYYEKGKDPWDYPDESLMTLCENCHRSTGLLSDWMAREVRTLDQKRDLMRFHYAMEGGGPYPNSGPLREMMFSIFEFIKDFETMTFGEPVSEESQKLFVGLDTIIMNIINAKQFAERTMRENQNDQA